MRGEKKEKSFVDFEKWQKLILKNAYLVAKIRFDTAENEPIEKNDVSWLNR